VLAALAACAGTRPPPGDPPIPATQPPSVRAPIEPATTAGTPACATPSPQDATCTAVELTGAAPCETICRQPRAAAPDRCCEGPVDVVVASDGAELLRVGACEFVPPDCADVHGHGFMDAQLRVLSASPPELLLVEGGCESRALAHGYVPDSVAA